MRLRTWQREALTKYLANQPTDFLAVATPGAGKTTFALSLAKLLKDNRVVDKVIVVVPTEHLKVQWSVAAARFGIILDPEFSNSDAVNKTVDGLCVTYAQVALHPAKHYAITTSAKTLVILDEIHHGGDARSWGDGIRDAYCDATRRLALTGTPFRSDDSAIPFVTYEEGEGGFLSSKADYTYGYAEALRDGVVRPVVFLAYSGNARWRDSAGEEYEARLSEQQSKEITARAWKTALDPKGDWIPAVLKAAHTRLNKLRERMPDAGGLVIATDTQKARAYARILSHLSHTPVAVVLSDEEGSSERIKTFAESTDEWMVAVRMVSEGVDVPRLAVGVYATSASTPLFFAQAIGRFVRSRIPGETASVFLPSIPVLLDLAAQLETQRDHILGKPHREKEGWDDEALADSAREKNEPGLDNTYESLGADAELDSLIFEGSTYGTAGMSYDDSEADYLGLPGLLDKEQMKQLLAQRQAKEIKRDKERLREKKKARLAKISHVGLDAVREEENSSADESHVSAADLPRLRRELNALIAIASHRTGKPHNVLHNEVREACGGPMTALCSAHELKKRIDYLRGW